LLLPLLVVIPEGNLRSVKPQELATKGADNMPLTSKFRIAAKVTLALAILIAAYAAIPASNTNLTRFDTLIVLGMPCLPDGSPSPTQRSRVLEAVREYQKGIAPRIIMTGGAAHNRFVEADSMKRLAIEQGVPANAILEETQSRNTIQNIAYTNRLMQQNNWHSAEIISNPIHLKRTALILAFYHLAWRTHASH
jgi:uncharacterized SAM-binding protein YcdF (DUF218 family)